MSMHYDKGLVDNARALRQNATKQENHLWYDFLSRYPVRFQRQKPIGSYIVDFYCHKARLVVELDGSQHFEETVKQYDEVRTQYLESLGLRVLRIPNIDIDRYFESVCILIDNTIRESTPPVSLR